MKTDITNKIYKKVFDLDFNQKNVNKLVKAVVINYGDERGDIIVTNDNFGTRRKYADFTEGKKKAGLHPMSIIFTCWEAEHHTNGRYINANDEIVYF